MYLISFRLNQKQLRILAENEEQRDQMIEFRENTEGVTDISWVEVPDPEPPNE